MNAEEFFPKHDLPTPLSEYRFHPKRRWRFDYAWPAYRLALELEGGVWVGGRHINPKGFIADLEKYNTAAILGWRVIRVTPRAMGTLTVVHLVRQAIDGKEAAA